MYIGIKLHTCCLLSLYPLGLLGNYTSGTLFVTTRDTLARNPDTYFAAMLRMHPPPDDGCDSGSSSAANGGGGGSGGLGGDDSAAGSSSSSNGVEFFIDRDPTHFR